MKIRNRLFILIMIIAIASTQWVPAFAASKDGPDITAESVIVIEADSGKILYEKDAYSKRDPASTTKILTCLIALEHLEMDQEITVQSDAVEMGSIIGVKKGEVFTAEQLLYALMLYSANDAAVVIAEEIGGSEDGFAKIMNKRAAECGAEDSHFRNPNGLNWAWHQDHRTTAYDLAMITREALKNDTFRKIVGTLYYEIPETNKSEARSLFNTNKFLWDEETEERAKEYKAKFDESGEIIMPPETEGVIGVKTGLTSTAGSCFVGAIDYHGVELISVVLHSDKDYQFNDTAAVWEYVAKENYDTYTIMEKGTSAAKVRVTHGKSRRVEAVTETTVAAALPKGTEVDLTTEIEKSKISAPVKKGDVVGVIKVYNNGELVNERNLIAAEDVDTGIAPVTIAIWAVVILAGIRIVIGFVKKQRARNERRRRREERQEKDV